MHEKYIYVGKRRVIVDEFSVGGDDFIKLVKKKYRTLHDGQSLPKIYKTKYDSPLYDEFVHKFENFHTAKIEFFHLLMIMLYF